MKVYCELAMAGKAGDETVQRVADAVPPQIAPVSEDYGKVAEAARKEVEAVKAGKVTAAPTSMVSKGKT